VPRDLPVRVRAGAGLGSLKLFEQKADGFGPRLEYNSPDYASAVRRLQLEADLGLGDISVQYGKAVGGTNAVNLGEDTSAVAVEPG
jgi:predicted membrane protein